MSIENHINLWGNLAILLIENVELKFLKPSEKVRQSTWNLGEEPLKGRSLRVPILTVTFREVLIFFLMEITYFFY